MIIDFVQIQRGCKKRNKVVNGRCNVVLTPASSLTLTGAGVLGHLIL